MQCVSDSSCKVHPSHRLCHYYLVGTVQTHPVLLDSLATLVLHLHPSVQVNQDPLLHLGILAFHFVPAALVDREGRPVALVDQVGLVGLIDLDFHYIRVGLWDLYYRVLLLGHLGIIGIENCSHPLACSCMLGMLVVVVMVMMGDSGMACRLRNSLIDLVGLSMRLVLICLEGLVSLVGHLEGLVDHLVALSVQMTLACPLSWC